MMLATKAFWPWTLQSNSVVDTPEQAHSALASASADHDLGEENMSVTSK
jgi:hypothetical protein